MSFPAVAPISEQNRSHHNILATNPVVHYNLPPTLNSPTAPHGLTLLQPNQPRCPSTHTPGPRPCLRTFALAAYPPGMFFPQRFAWLTALFTSHTEPCSNLRFSMRSILHIVVRTASDSQPPYSQCPFPTPRSSSVFFLNFSYSLSSV